MKRNYLMISATLLIIFLNSIILFAQKTETFDIISFKTPKGWQKEVGQSAVQFGVENDKGICLVTMFKPLAANADSKTNFASAWETIVKDLLTVSGEPQMLESASENGWTSESGFAGYESDGRKGIVLLVAISGGGKMVNILILTDSDAFQQDIDSFLQSVNLPKVVESSQKTVPTADNSIVGTWGKAIGSSISYANPISAATAGYTKDQYIFNSDGTYQFYSKLFRYSLDKLLLVKESGSYQISGNNLTLSPAKSVIESWSKKNGTDKWGNLTSTQNRPIEKVTYQFTKYYFSGIGQWNLVLQTANPTKRDGSFSGNTTFSNAYYYAPISSSNTAIELP